MADQSDADFKYTYTMLQTDQNLCRAGEVRKLADTMALIESQELESKPKKQRQWEIRQEVTKSMQEDATTPPTPEIKQEGAQPNMTKMKFSKAAKKTQAAKRKESKAKKAQTLQRVKRRAKLLARGQAKTIPKLEEVALLLSRQYCFAFAAKMVQLLPMEQVEIQGQHAIQRMNVGQPLPEPTAVLPRSTCTVAIAEIDMKIAGDAGNAVYIGRWDEFGYATVGQLNTMVLVIDAREAMPKVEETLQWIGNIAIPTSGVIPPFNDCIAFPQLLFEDTVENMTLNKYSLNGEEIEGVRLLKFRGTEWLESTWLRAGLIMFARGYVSSGVGIFMPDWYLFSDLPRQQRQRPHTEPFTLLFNPRLVW